MPREGKRRVPKQKALAEVFLNLPYDPNFVKLFIAYICAIHALGMVPRVALEIAESKRRLERIFELLQSCEFSVHDLSRVQLDREKPRTPRFNMPFELGLAVACEMTSCGQHVWFVLESVKHRLTKSLSDLNGTDPCIHGGTVEGVFREMRNALEPEGRRPSVPQMWLIYREVRSKIPAIMKRCGARAVFEPRVFQEISYAANVAASKIVA
jgi:hypothetical protein